MNELSEIKKRYVTMTNALTRAGHGLTLAEKRLVTIALSCIDSKCKRVENIAYSNKVSANDYAETYNVSLDTAYRQLKAASEKLFERKITFFEPEHKREGKPLRGTIVRMRWVSRVEYHDGDGWVQLYFVPQLMQHLIGIGKQFTSYKLEQATALRSIYSWKLLELLMRFNGTSWAQYSIDDFCASMDVTEKTKADFGSVRRRIIEPAIKELTEKDGWIIEWLPIRQGSRKVTGVKFKFKRNPQQQLVLE